MDTAIYCGRKEVTASQVLFDDYYSRDGPFHCPVCKHRVVYRYFSNQSGPIFAHSPPNESCPRARGGMLDFDRW